MKQVFTSADMDKYDFMNKALEQARLSFSEGEVPVGAVIVRNGEVVSVGRNRRETVKNALCHAEIEAIDKACKALGGWRLWECEMFVTLEPCPMCAGAIINSRIKKVTFGATDEKNGAVVSVMNLFKENFTHKPEFEKGVLEDDCSEILSDFFSQLRNNRKDKQKNKEI